MSNLYEVIFDSDDDEQVIYQEKKFQDDEPKNYPGHNYETIKKEKETPITEVEHDWTEDEVQHMLFDFITQLENGDENNYDFFRLTDDSQNTFMNTSIHDIEINSNLESLKLIDILE